MNYKILVVDDEPLARLRITNYLRQNHPRLKVSEAQDGVEALAVCRTDPPHVLFLDIEMPGLTGLEVIQQLQSDAPQVVFQTAYDQFAIEAFEANACDYLLKPYSDERLEKAMSRALDQLGSSASSTNELKEHLIKERAFLEKIVVTVGSKLKVIPIEEVLYFFSEHHATKVVLPDVDYTCDMSLSALEEQLDPEKFLRLHRNSVVKLDQIAEIEKGGSVTAVLKNGAKLSVSRERAKLLKRRLGR